MSNKKKEVYKVKPLTKGKKNIISAMLEEYDIDSADDIQEVLKGSTRWNRQIDDGCRDECLSWLREL